MKLLDICKGLEDTRRKQAQQYSYSFLFLTSVLAYCCGCRSYRKIASFCEGNITTLSEHLSHSGEIPTYVTFYNFIKSIDYEKLTSLFNEWTNSNVSVENLQGISGDGKALRSTMKNTFDLNQNFVQIVSLFTHKTGLNVLVGSFENKKEGEQKVLQGLLAILKKKRCVITLDALYCCKKTVQDIEKSGNYCLIQVKENNKKMYDFIQELSKQPSENVYEETERIKGKTVTRTTFVYNFDTKNFDEKWHILKSIIVVKREVRDKENNIISYENAFYVSSLNEVIFNQLNTDKNLTLAQKFHRLVRQHWHIENRLHWVKDVIFNEDKNGIKEKNKAIVIAIFNNIAINILRALGFESISYGSILFAPKLKTFINQI